MSDGAWFCGFSAGACRCWLLRPSRLGLPESAWRSHSPRAPAGQRRPQEAATRKRAPESADKGLNTGIKVHGHWTLEVRDPDGSLVRHVEFENSLVGSTGSYLLAGLLTGTYSSSAQTWSITISGSPNLCSFNNGPSFCLIESPSFCTGPCQSNAFNTLSVTSPSNSSNTGDIVKLTGSALAAFAGQINYVETDDIPCTSTVAPQSCTWSSSGQVGYQFTSAPNFTGSPVAVAAGQTIQVTVAISFQ